MKTCAIIPFYNEARFINQATNEVLNYVDHIIAIDDGSTDNSKELIASNANITLISHQKNLGKGAALKNGFLKSIELGFDVTITIDADLQHDPKCIPNFLKEIKNCDIILGNRLNDISSMPFLRIFSNKITSKIISLKTGIQIIDSQNGFRAFKNHTLKLLIPKSCGFEAESEVLILAGKNNFKINHVEIPTIYGNENSKMKNLKAIKGFLKVILKY